MKKVILISAIILLSVIILFFACAIYGRLGIVKEREKKESMLPQICLNGINGEYFCLYDLLNKPVLVIYFGTECSYCEKEAVLLLSNMEKLKECNIVMISSDSMGAVEAFAVSYQLKEVEEIKIVADTAMVFYDHFSFLNIPSILIYDVNGKLIQRYSGETHIEAIINQIELAKK